MPPEQTDWTFGTIEPSFTQTRAGHEVRGFPALVDEGATVGLRVMASAGEQDAHHRLGVRRLLLLAVPSPAAKLLAGLDNASKLGLAASPYANVRALVEDCVTAAAGEVVDQAAPVRDPESFQALVERTRRELPDASAGVLQQVLRVLAEWRPVEKALHGRVEMAMLPAMTDLRAQLGRLVHPGFVAEAGAAALRDYPRYLRAMALRVERLADQARDRELMDRVDVLQRPGSTGWTPCPRVDRWAPTCAGCGGCSRSTGSASGRSRSAPPSRSPTPASARPSAER